MYKCIFCEQEFKEAPTDDFWFGLSTLKGIHYRCVDRLADVLAAIRQSLPTMPPVTQTVGRKPESETSVPKIICDGCPIMNESDDVPSCNLGYSIFSAAWRSGVYKEAAHHKESDDCNLELVRYAGTEFRPTKYAHRPETGVAKSDNESTFPVSGG